MELTSGEAGNTVALMKVYLDLGAIARDFAKTAEFDYDVGGILHRQAHEAFEDKRIRNIVVLPSGRTAAVRFFLLGAYRYFAYAPVSRLGDLARFADVLFYYLKPLRERDAAGIPEDSDLTFDVSQMESDIEYFKVERPDIQGMIDKIVAEVKDAKASRAVQAPTWNQKTGIERITAFFSRLFALLEDHHKAANRRHDDTAKRLEDITSQLRVLDAQVEAISEGIKHITARGPQVAGSPYHEKPAPSEPTTEQITCNSNDTQK